MGSLARITAIVGPQMRWAIFSISAARSPITTHGAMVLPVVTRGMMEPSAIRTAQLLSVSVKAVVAAGNRPDQRRMYRHYVVFRELGTLFAIYADAFIHRGLCGGELDRHKRARGYARNRAFADGGVGEPRRPRRRSFPRNEVSITSSFCAPT